jgi:hypothetical protein
VLAGRGRALQGSSRADPAALAPARASRLLSRNRDRSGGRSARDRREWLCLDAAGVDLSRSWSRWPLPDAAWQRSCAAIAHGARGAAALRFWLIAMAARSAVSLAGPGTLAPPLARLRALASGAAS